MIVIRARATRHRASTARRAAPTKSARFVAHRARDRDRTATLSDARAEDRARIEPTTPARARRVR